jgi:hypothetical protein
MYNGYALLGLTKEGKNAKPTVIPSKSHSVAVFIYHEDYHTIIAEKVNTLPRVSGFR